MIRLKNVAIVEAHFEAAGRLAPPKVSEREKIKIIRVFSKKLHFLKMQKMTLKCSICKGF